MSPFEEGVAGTWDLPLQGPHEWWAQNQGIGQRPALPHLLPQGLVSSQDAPSPLFLPGFLLPFPVPHPVLGAGAEENTFQRDWDFTEANATRASGCYRTRSRVRATAMTHPGT